MAETLESALHERHADLDSAHAIMSALVRTTIDAESTIFGCTILHMEEHYYLPKLFMDWALLYTHRACEETVWVPSRDLW